MKQIVKVASAVAIALGLGMGTAQAENSLRNGSFALNVPVKDTIMNGEAGGAPLMVNGKFMIAKDAALLAGFGIGIWGADAKGTDIGVKGGYRKYMSTSDFAPFAGVSLSYISYLDSNEKQTLVMGEFGAEYFMSRQFSIEGAARAGYGSHDSDITGLKSTKIGTFGAGLSVNYYF